MITWKHLSIANIEKLMQHRSTFRNQDGYRSNGPISTGPEILKPYLRGQDIKRWSPEWAGRWMIFTRRGIDMSGYSSVLRHLARYQTQLEPRPENWEGEHWPGRKPGSYKWYEIQDTINYFELFDKPKIVWQDLSYHSRFCLCGSGLVPEVTCFFLPTTDTWLLAVLNSPLVWCWLWRNTIHGKDEVLRLKNIYTEQIPIALISDQVRINSGALSNRLVEITSVTQSCVRDLLDWLKVEFAIAAPTTKLQNPIGLSSDAFIDEVKKVRGKSKGLTSPQVKALRDEYARAVEPARALADEAKGLELRIHDLVQTL